MRPGAMQAEKFLSALTKTAAPPSKSKSKSKSPRLAGLWIRWLQRRLPATDRVRLDRKNLFIFPVREGTVFIGLLVLMLLTGINYQNSLIYLLTFLLGTLFYVGIVQTHDNLSGLVLSLTGTGEGYAGTPLTFTLKLTSADGSDRPAVELSLPDVEPELGQVVHIQGQAQNQNNAEITLGFIPGQRGLVALPRIRIETRYPMGLFRAWSYLWLQSPVLAYPRPIAPTTRLLSGAGEDDGEQLRPSSTPSDELLLTPYRPGDPLQRVQWKRYAKNAQMVIAERDSISTDSQWLDYANFPGADMELRLSYLTWLIDEAHARGQAYGLRLPGQSLAPGSGVNQRRRALRMVALFQPAPS